MTARREFTEDNVRYLQRSILRRGDHTLSCDVIVRDGQFYDVCVMPHWDLSASIVETFARATHAVRRHAELSWLLRQDGWDRLLGVEGEPPRKPAAA